MSGYTRGQVLCVVTENHTPHANQFVERRHAKTGRDARDARREVEATIARLFSYGAWADKYDGAVHHVPIRGVTLAMNEAVGVIGVSAPMQWPLLGFVSLVAPVIAVGNTVVALPSTAQPLAATDFYSV